MSILELVDKNENTIFKNLVFACIVNQKMQSESLFVLQWW